MTKHHVNSTGRLPITREKVTIMMLPEVDGLPRAQATISLSGLKFPKDAAVILEAYRASSMVRFDCGTVSKLFVPPVIHLGDIEIGGSILFRVKVVKDGMIIGLLQKIRPSADGFEPGKEPLLSIKPADLGQRVCKISGDLEEAPMLLLNRNISGIEKKLQTDLVFRGATILFAVETILNRIVVSEPGDDPDDWKNRWLRFCSDILGTDECPFEDDYDIQRDWVDSNLIALSRQAAFVDNILKRENSDE